MLSGSQGVPKSLRAWDNEKMCIDPGDIYRRKEKTERRLSR